MDAAGYSNNAISENESIKIFRYLLNSSKVVDYINSNDKTPNSDGYLEFIDEKGTQLGKIEVQTLRENYVKASYNINLSLLSYITKCQLPFLFIGVDQSDKKFFWTEIDLYKAQDLIEIALAKDSKQATIAVVFEEENVVPDNLPYDKWDVILNKSLNIKKEFSELKDKLVITNEKLILLEAKFGDIDYNTYYKPIHHFLDMLNDLFKKDFNNISKILFEDFWKFGIAILGEINANKITYSLFSIDWNENIKQINAFKDDRDFLEFANDYPSVRGYSGQNPIISNPQEYAYVKVWEYLQLILDGKYIWPNNQYLKVEYLFYINDYLIEKDIVNKADNIDLISFKEKIDNYLLNISEYERELMKEFPNIEINLYRAINYIQDVRMNGDDIANRLSPSGEKIRQVLDSIRVQGSVFSEQAEEVLNNYWESLITSYTGVVNEFFPTLSTELNFHGEYNTWIVIPSQLLRPANFNIPIPQLGVVKFNILVAPNRIIVERDFSNVTVNFNNATLTYDGIKYSNFQTDTIGISKLVSKMPIRIAVLSMLESRLKKYFDSKK